MVSLINHEYSRREAHGRLAWQSMRSNAKAERTRPVSEASGSEDPSQAECSSKPLRGS